MRRVLLPLVLLILAFAAWWAIGRGEPGPQPVVTHGAEGKRGEAPVHLEGRAPGPDDVPAPPGPGEVDPGDGHELPPAWLELPASVLVVDAATGTPVPGAVIEAVPLCDEVGPRRVTTDADGRARVPRARSGALWSIRQAGYVFLQREVGTDLQPPPLRLEPAPALLGRVVGAATGDPLPGVRILATWADANRARADREQTTGADGRFEIAGVPPERRVDLILAKDGFATVRTRSDGTDRMEVRLGAGAEVHGRVLDTAGRGVAAARVYVVEEGAPSPRTPSPLFGATLDAMWPSAAVADAVGRFGLRGVPTPSRVVVFARSSRRVGRSPPLALQNADARFETEIVVSAPGRIEVALRDATAGDGASRGRSRFSIDADWAHAEDHQRSAWDRERQVDVFERVSPGPHTIHVLPDGHLAPPPVDVEVVAGETTTVLIDVEAGRTVTGRVVDDAGRPVEAYVTFEATWRGVAQLPSAHPREDGRFTLRGVPPTEGTLRVFEHVRGSERTWEDMELAADLGDLVLPRPPSVVGALPLAWHDVALIGGHESASLRSQVGEIEYEEGRFRVDGLVANEATTLFLRPEGAGTALVVRDLVLAPGEERDLGLLEIPEPVDLDGRILDANGAPLSGAEIRTVERWYDERTRTDPQGCFRLSRFPPDPTTLWIETGPSAVAFVRVAAVVGMAPLEIRLPAPGRLRCRIVREDGAPVPGTPVNVARLGDDGEPVWDRRTIPRTDSLGRLDLALYPGGYAVIPHANAKLEAVGDDPHVEIVSGGTLEFELRVREAP